MFLFLAFTSTLDFPSLAELRKASSIALLLAGAGQSQPSSSRWPSGAHHGELLIQHLGLRYHGNHLCSSCQSLFSMVYFLGMQVDCLTNKPKRQVCFKFKIKSFSCINCIKLSKSRFIGIWANHKLDMVQQEQGEAASREQVGQTP